MSEIFLIFFAAAIVNNFVLTYFLGICPFIGVSKKTEAAFSMGMATTFVMTLTAVISWLVNNLVLIKFNLPFLQYVAFILTIASLVQFVEMYVKKASPTLYRSLGIYLPLITTNCAVLGLALFASLRGYSFIETLFFGVGTGVGFTLALVMMAGIREELQLGNVPKAMEGPAITLLVAGMMALAFM
ncbi:hypothetical protein LCGC14_1789380, partial [marine sediment metagenome]